MPAVARGEIVCCAVFVLAGCVDKGEPEYAADQFVDAYFRRMDQQAARQFTALGATEMLDRELDLTRGVRADGYTPAQAAADVVCKRLSRSARGERVRFDYDVVIRHEQSEDHRAADIELAKIQSAWRVVRVDVKTK
ncbi:MAG TPA: hypothetical protein VJT73_03970 [Polyangiaceae bacterium]|nr:hypothetical protein [Polyangiaceae bacterium]